jgi:hypothetical protein
MARYIKANPKVAKFLDLERDRNTVSDGNYLLWQADMLAFGPLTQLTEILQQIGGIALMAHEAREEQDGTVCRPLPVATDPRFIMETAQANEPEAEPTPEPEPQPEAEPTPEPESEGASENENTGEGTGESEAQAETPNGESTGESETETPAENSPESETVTITENEVGNVEDLVDFTGNDNENTEE